MSRRALRRREEDEVDGGNEAARGARPRINLDDINYTATILATRSISTSDSSLHVLTAPSAAPAAPNYSAGALHLLRQQQTFSDPQTCFNDTTRHSGPSHHDNFFDSISSPDEDSASLLSELCETARSGAARARSAAKLSKESSIASHELLTGAKDSLNSFLVTRLATATKLFDELASSRALLHPS
jgi:hypothetical protein